MFTTLIIKQALCKENTKDNIRTRFFTGGRGPANVLNALHSTAQTFPRARMIYETDLRDPVFSPSNKSTANFLDTLSKTRYLLQYGCLHFIKFSAFKESRTSASFWNTGQLKKNFTRRKYFLTSPHDLCLTAPMMDLQQRESIIAYGGKFFRSILHTLIKVVINP